MGRYSSKVNSTTGVENQARICVGCQNSCFLTSCKGSCSSTCNGTGISRPAVRKEVEK